MRNKWKNRSEKTGEKIKKSGDGGGVDADGIVKREVVEQENEEEEEEEDMVVVVVVECEGLHKTFKQQHTHWFLAGCLIMLYQLLHKSDAKYTGVQDSSPLSQNFYEKAGEKIILRLY